MDYFGLVGTICSIVLSLALRQYKSGNAGIWETRLTTIKVLLPSNPPPIPAGLPTGAPPPGTLALHDPTIHGDGQGQALP